MATWMMHLRIADRFLDGVEEKQRDAFLIGSVAPDCGYGKKDSFAGFEPPTAVTHWTPTGRKTDIEADKFFRTYLSGGGVWGENAFYLGYYIHLLTDRKWSAEVYLPTREQFRGEYEKNPEFLLEIKKDWNDLDHLFLCKNPDFRAYKRFDEIGRISDYLPYYEKGQLKKQCRVITDFYNKFNDYSRLDREYKYLTEKRQNELVGEICAEVTDNLQKVGLI